jgi:hypothetical protein
MKTLDFSGSTLTSQRAKSHTGLYLVNRAGAAFWKCGSSEFLMEPSICYGTWNYQCAPKTLTLSSGAGNSGLLFQIGEYVIDEI